MKYSIWGPVTCVTLSVISIRFCAFITLTYIYITTEISLKYYRDHTSHYYSIFNHLITGL